MYCRFIISNILHDQEDLNEILNDVSLKAWNTIPPSHPESLKSYLGMLCRQLSLNRSREKRAKKRNSDFDLILEELSECISALISDSNLGGSVITQTVNTNAELRELAKMHNISVGKAQLINTISEINPDKTFEDLVPVSITELYLTLGEEYFDENNSSIDIEADGAVISKNYCGVDHAVKEALSHYGYSEKGCKSSNEFLQPLFNFGIQYHYSSSSSYKPEYFCILSLISAATSESKSQKISLSFSYTSYLMTYTLSGRKLA